ncbi:MAG: PQQ-binding-like beta-propeller repeat protein [Burkholderiales bacterium]|nr:PQQ-binding-like beta-propeller repeat protein [Burkholderiales bacterium]
MSNRSSPCDAALPAGSPGRLPRGLRQAAAAALLLVAPFCTLAGTTDLSPVPLATYTVGSTVDVKPNILMVLDDSGSMDWDFLPDWANLGSVPNYASAPPYLFNNASFNGVAYNPAVTYSPPVTFTSSGAKDTTTYPSMTGVSTTTGGDSSATSASPNWNSVKNDAYGVQSTSTSSLTGKAFYYSVLPGEYCDSPGLTNCTTSSVPTGNYQYPAMLRWCDSAALTNCKAQPDGSFAYPRITAPRVTTISFSGSTSTSVSGITVDGLQILSGATSASTTSSTVASAVATNINKCTFGPSGNCQVAGYLAFASGSTVRIYAPGTTSGTPSVSSTGGGMSVTTGGAFAAAKIPLPEYLWGSSTSSAPVPGENVRTVITSTTNSYPYPGTSAKAATRTDCAGTTCTYREEMTNYANWWTYYHTRMQMMKSSLARAFSTLDSDADIAAGTTRYRVGYFTINNNTGSDLVNVNDFDATGKFTWYSKVLKADPNNSTPLRKALANAGRLYAGKLDGTTFNGVTVTDPMQYSCQRNYTILSTDGFWNSGAGFKLDGSTLVGNQDGALPRPYGDGTTTQLQSRTSQLQTATYQQQQCTSRCNRSSSWTGVASCAPGALCRTIQVSSWINVYAPASCTITSPDSSGNYTNCRYGAWSSWSNVASCTAVAQSTGPTTFTVAQAVGCQTGTTGGTSDTLADVAAYYYNTDLRNASQTAPDATGTCTGPTISPSTTPNDLCANNVIPYGRDTATWQHMTVHTLGLGAQGQMVFSPYQNNLAGQRIYVPDYWSQPSGDFYSVANGSTASSSVCTWMSSGSTCTWPTPASDSIANIDDLWHAAVNGHGSYFSATDPSSLSGALSAVLAQIINTPRPGTAAAAASSNPNITSSDNYVFSSSYQSVNWFGELIMQRFNPDGTLSAQQWSAMQMMDCATTPWQATFTYAVGQVFNQGGACYLVTTAYTSGGTFAGGTGTDGANTTVLSGTPVTRTVYMAGSSGLVPFTWSNLTSAQQAYFSTPYINYVSASQGLSQFCSAGGSCLSSTAQTSASGQALVNYLSGDRTNEGTYFRARLHVLGDIVSSEARYVKQPLQTYLDTNYSAFATAQANRPPTVYVGANDGMLHAFDALTGQERWAYIPTAVMPNLYRLADMNYANNHQYFVDGTPEVGDICPNAPSSTCSASQWRTIIVGGLNEGGKSYYALDITDPTAPKLLWEFSDANMGYSYGNPRITKLSNGTWVVILASGYNNADGVGRVYVLNAATGALINTISTGVGTASNPSGLNKLAARSTTSSTNNTVEEVYGGDLLGNVWRVDVNGNIGAAGTDAQLLINLQDASGNPQPITTKPVVAAVNNLPLVMVGTGRYLGLTDLSDTKTYSMYAIKDALGTTTMTTPRASGSKFVQQTLTATTCPTGASTSICTQGQSVLTASSNSVDWSIDNGWYIDFVNPGERSVTDASLALGTLVFTTIKPQTSTTGTVTGCTGTDTSVNAQSFLYFLDYLTGGAVSGTQGVVGELLCTCVATRPSVVKTQAGTVEGIIRMSGGGVSTGTDMGVTSRQDLPYNASGGSMRRTSWRELNGD